MERITIRLPEQQVDDVEQLVENGLYPSKSELVRSAVRSLVYEQQRQQQQASE